MVISFECAGAVQRQQLRCRRHGRLCGLYENRRLQHPARHQLQHGGDDLRGPELWRRQPQTREERHVGHAGHGCALHPLHRRSAAGVPGSHHAPVHLRRDGGGLRVQRHALLLPLLLSAGHPPRHGGRGARHRPQRAADGGAAHLALPLPCGVDPVRPPLLCGHRGRVRPLPGVVGAGCRADGPLRMERQSTPRWPSRSSSASS